MIYLNPYRTRNHHTKLKLRITPNHNTTTHHLKTLKHLSPQTVSIISVFFILISIFTFCLKTHPSLRVPAVKNISSNDNNTQPSIIFNKNKQLPRSYNEYKEYKKRNREKDLYYDDEYKGKNRLKRDKKSGFIIETTNDYAIKSFSSTYSTTKPTPLHYETESHNPPKAYKSLGKKNKDRFHAEKKRTEPHDAFFYIECICNAWFTFELIVR